MQAEGRADHWIFEVSSAADAKNVAGNTLDNALQRFVLDRSRLSPESAEARLAGHALRRQVRAFKEQLFRSGRVMVELPHARFNTQHRQHTTRKYSHVGLANSGSLMRSLATR